MKISFEGEGLPSTGWTLLIQPDDLKTREGREKLSRFAKSLTAVAFKQLAFWVETGTVDPGEASNAKFDEVCVKYSGLW
jgi:hypothetical protein